MKTKIEKYGFELFSVSRTILSGVSLGIFVEQHLYEL